MTSEEERPVSTTSGDPRNLNQFLEENWKPIEEAIAKEDFAAFDALFNKAIEAANAFHELHDKWFIKWKLPSQPPPDLDLTPRKK